MNGLISSLDLSPRRCSASAFRPSWLGMFVQGKLISSVTSKAFSGIDPNSFGQEMKSWI